MESEAFLAATENDEEEVRRMLALMTPYERDKLHEAAVKLAEIVNTTFSKGPGL